MRTEGVPSASIVIRCRDEAASLGRVLEATFAQEGAPRFEVVALDSGSRDGTLELLARSAARVERIPAEAFSYGRALNRGAALARGEIVVYLSAHCPPLSRRWLAALLGPFATAGVVAAFGRQVPRPGVNPIEAITTARNFPAAPPPAVRFSTANGAVRRAAVLGRPFDEEVAIAEDHLWASALPRTAVAYVPAAAVEHSHPMTLSHWGARFYAHGLAEQYARRRLGVELPWGGDDTTAAGVALRRVAPFLRLAATLGRRGEVRALGRLPAYALARTVCYARGLREGARRYSPLAKE
jgi:glycosyltransferase involved in cell wall biosynthesis